MPGSMATLHGTGTLPATGPITSHAAGPITSHAAGSTTSHAAGSITSHAAGSTTSHAAGSTTSHAAGSTTSHTSRTEPQDICSSARCRVFRGQKLKLLKDKKVAKGQSQPEYALVRNRAAFEYSAASYAAGMSTSATNPTRKTAPTTRNAASFLHYLERKINLTISNIDLYNRDLVSGVSMFNSKISSYARNLDRRIQRLNAIKYSYADVERDIQRLKDQQGLIMQDIEGTRTLLIETRDEIARELENLNARKDECDMAAIMEEWKADTSIDAHELDRRIKKLTAKKDDFEALNKQIQEAKAMKDAYLLQLDMQMKLLQVTLSQTDDLLDKQMKLLYAKKDSLARDLVRQVEMLNTRTDSYARDLERRIYLLDQQITSYHHDIRRQSELVDSRKAPFVHDLDRQLKLLDSKIAAFYHDFRKQQDLMNSNLHSYFNDLHRKMELLNSSIASYLGKDISAANTVT